MKINLMKEELVLRNSRQRRILLEELQKLKTHPTADIIYRIVRRKLPKISFGTVYRNLNLLRDQNKVLELTNGRYSCRYDGNINNHYHFLCKNCGNVLDIDFPLIKDIEKEVSRKTGFTIETHRLEFCGICKECNEKKGR